MSHFRTSGPSDAGPGDCPADGPVEPGRSVVSAVECNTARFVDLTGKSGGIDPTYLVLTTAEEADTSLSRTDVYALPELQNALAYLGPGTNSVRVQTCADRRKLLGEHVASLADGGGPTFEFADRQFDLDVLLG
ncbi:hypothetical protein [Halobacterium wangiae]|uniref:hypothetical protein n=1 Tax=Halobacterium wangiae TaxID=2902623 RepID=UPI001E5A5E5C|nr:hypothetical protein [Halobacterium wangiae]